MTTDLDRLALAVLLPAFPGTTLPADWAELFAEGLGGVCLFGSNTADGPDAVAALTAVDPRGRAARGRSPSTRRVATSPGCTP